MKVIYLLTLFTKVLYKVTKCTFHKYGPSGTVMKHDGLCVLPSNIINEKIYIFVWFWLVAVAAITAAFLLYRVAVIAGPAIRVALIAVKVTLTFQLVDTTLSISATSPP